MWDRLGRPGARRFPRAVKTRVMHDQAPAKIEKVDLQWHGTEFNPKISYSTIQNIRTAVMERTTARVLPYISTP